MTERTPGEWVMENVRDFSGEHICFIRAEGEGDIARTRGVHPATVQANAEYIVRVVNAHDALVAAALAALERCVACGHERQWHGERDCSMCAERDVLDACRTFRVDEGLRAAVALAEEGDHDATD